MSPLSLQWIDAHWWWKRSRSVFPPPQNLEDDVVNVSLLNKSIIWIHFWRKITGSGKEGILIRYCIIVPLSLKLTVISPCNIVFPMFSVVNLLFVLRHLSINRCLHQLQNRPRCLAEVLVQDGWKVSENLCWDPLYRQPLLSGGCSGWNPFGCDMRMFSWRVVIWLDLLNLFKLNPWWLEY